MSNHQVPTDEFIKLLTEHQSQLLGFVMASLGNYENAADVLQQTNVVLWQKAEQLRAGSEFLPWALAIAKFKVLSFVRDQQRERLVFSPEITEQLSELALTRVEDMSTRRLALRECLKKLPPPKQEMLQQYYTYNLSIAKIAANTQSSAEAIKSRLKRVRRTLAECVDRSHTQSIELA